jgi:pyruvate, water dikinase
VASKYSAHAMTYRYMLGIRDDDVLMCVGCLSMVTSRAGGVVYTTDPLDASGQSHPDHFRLGRGQRRGRRYRRLGPVFMVEKSLPPRIVERLVPRKDSAIVCSEIRRRPQSLGRSIPGGPADPWRRTDHRTRDHGRAHRGALRDTAQDIEWAYTPEGRLFLLQTRPLDIRQSDPVPELLPDVEPLVQGGQTASSGTAHGVVHIVKKDVDILMLPDKAIMVCVEAAPKWAAVLNRCQGVIAEQGSVAGHLANVAREFNVPATVRRTLGHDNPERGPEITLDADNRAVYDGLQSELLDRLPERPNMMEGSPVFRTLQRQQPHHAPQAP